MHYRRRQSLLIVFVLCGVLMVSLGALARAGSGNEGTYVIASLAAQTTLIQSQLQSIFGNVQVITPAQDYSDFNGSWSSVGMFNMVVVSDYPSVAVLAGQQIHPPQFGERARIVDRPGGGPDVRHPASKALGSRPDLRGGQRRPTQRPQLPFRLSHPPSLGDK